MNPLGTFLRVLGPEPWNAVYLEPSVRPDDSRYGDNPNRLACHHQIQASLLTQLLIPCHQVRSEWNFAECLVWLHAHSSSVMSQSRSTNEHKIFPRHCMLSLKPAIQHQGGMSSTMGDAEARHKQCTSLDPALIR